MRLRLTHFPGLRIELPPGWYVVPSHVSALEVERMLDVLASGVEGISHVLMLTWEEAQRAQGRPGSLMYVQVPPGVAAGTTERLLDGIETRLGLVQYTEPPQWPDVAWDELEVKSALVSWWRRECMRPDHPLEAIGIGELPVDVLAGATSEPIEFLTLIEGAIEVRERQAQPWLICAWWSIARRLTIRMRALEPNVKRRIFNAVSDSRHFVPGVDVALVQAGLAMPIGGSLVLSPLARMAQDQSVKGFLQLLGLTVEQPEAGRGDEVELEPAVALATSGALDANDPRLVTLDGETSGTRRQIVARVQAAMNSARHASIAVLQQTGIGGSTAVRVALSSLQPMGIVAAILPSAVLKTANDGRFDLLHSTIVELIDYFDRLPGPGSLSAEVTDYFVAGENSRPPQIVAAALIEAIGDRLAASRKQLCVVFDDLNGVDRRDEVMRALADMELHRWACHKVLLLGVTDQRCGLSLEHEVVWATTFPTDDMSRTRALIERRFELSKIFAEPHACIALLAQSHGGHLGHLWELLRLSLVTAGEQAVAVEHVRAAISMFSRTLISRVAPHEWGRLEHFHELVDVPSLLERGEDHLLRDMLLLPHGDEPRWFMHPLVHQASPFRKTGEAPPTVLYVGSLPHDFGPLQLGREIRAIQRAFDDRPSAVHVVLDGTFDEVRKILLSRRYDIVHVAGHGDGRGFFVMGDEFGASVLIDVEVLFGAFEGVPLRCIILSFNNSAARMADVSVRGCPVIAFNGAVEDEAAVVFARGFYEAVAMRRHISECFSEGCVRLTAHGFDHARPGFRLFQA